MKKSFWLFAAAVLLTAPAAGFTKTSRFHDLNVKVPPGVGSMEFQLEMLKDISKDPHNHVLLLGVSSDASEEYKMEIIQEDLIIHRRFAKCVLTAFVYKQSFRPGERHTLRLSWNGDSTRFTIDGNVVKKLGNYSSQDLPKVLLPEVRLGVEENFRIKDFRTGPESDARADSVDQEFVKGVVCTDLPQLLSQPSQEEYRGVALRNFPDEASRRKIRGYVDLLPEGFRGSIKSIVYVEDARFLKGGQGGFADLISGSLVLKGSLFSDPTVFFHEVAHLYDFKLGVNIGSSDEKSEWARISGASCYFKGSDMKQYYEEFQKSSAKNGILGAQGGQCASEDLAIWVATVYDRYLKGKTLGERLNPSSSKYSPKNIQKMDFILRKGFISQDVYGRVTRLDDHDG